VAVEAGLQGQIGDTDSEDWYASDVPPAQVLSVSFKVQAARDSHERRGARPGPERDLE
jgi:hypothetical protein